VAGGGGRFVWVEQERFRETTWKLDWGWNVLLGGRRRTGVLGGVESAFGPGTRLGRQFVSESDAF